MADQIDLYKEGLSSLPQKFFQNDWRYFCSMGPITSLLLLLQPILPKNPKKEKNEKRQFAKKKFFLSKVSFFASSAKNVQTRNGDLI